MFLEIPRSIFATAPHLICSVKTLNERPGFPTRIPRQKNEGVEKGRVQSERHARFKRGREEELREKKTFFSSRDFPLEKK